VPLDPAILIGVRFHWQALHVDPQQAGPYCSSATRSPGP